MAGTLTTLEKILFLKQVSLFSELSARDLQHLAQETTEVEFPRNIAIFEEGDVGDALYVIISGHAAVMLGHGDERNMVTILQERECFGEMAVLTDEPRAASVESVTPLRVLRISRNDFRNVLMAHPHMAFNIFDILIKRLRATTRLYHDLEKG